MVDSTSTLSSPTLSRWSWKKRLGTCAALLVLDLFFSFYHISDMPLLDPDEPRYAAAGRTMAEGGSWLVPKFNGEPRLNKPPLFYWMVALSNKAWGESNEVSARLPSILMGMLMLALTVWLGVRLFGDATGFLGGLILCTSPLYLAISRACIIDQTFSTLLSIALACLLLGLVGRWPLPKVSPVLAAGIVGGIAFMAKGTAAVIVVLTPFLFILLFYRSELLAGPGKGWLKVWLLIGITGIAGSALWRAFAGPPIAPPFLPFPSWALAALVMAVLSTIYYGLRTFWKSGPWKTAIIMFVLLGGWWYALLVIGGVLDIQEKIHTEIMKRLQGKMHKEPIIYYLYVFPALLLPWSFGLIAALGNAAQSIRTKLPLPRSTPSQDRTLVVTADTFLLAWVATVVLFFSIPGAKLGTYVLPAFPAASLLLARFLIRRAGAGEPLNKKWNLSILAVSILLAEVLLFMALEPHERLRGNRMEPSGLKAWASILLPLLTVLIFAAAIYSARSIFRIFPRDPAKPFPLFPVIKALGAPILATLLMAELTIPSRIIVLPNRWQGVIDESPLPLWAACAIFFLSLCVPWIILSLSEKYVRGVVISQKLFIVFAVVFIAPIALPGINRRSNRNLCQILDAELSQADRVFSVGCEEESLSYYLHRSVKEMRRPRKTQGERHQDVVKETISVAPPGKVILFVHHRYFRRWLKSKAPPGSKIIEQTDHIVVLINKEH